MKRLLCAVLLSCVYASAQQINPKQILPSTTNGQVLTTVGGVSVWAAGGGGGCTGCVLTNPSGTQKVGQPPSTSLNINSLESFYYADQYGDEATNGISTVTGLSTACLTQNATGPSGCGVNVSPIYPNTEIPQGYGQANHQFGQGQTNGFTWPNGTAVYDYRNGVTQFAYQNPMSNAPSQGVGLSVISDITRTNLQQQPFPGTVPGSFGASMNVYAGGSNYFGYPTGSPQYVYKPFYVGAQFSLNQYSSGQNWGYSDYVNCHGLGDCFAHEIEVTVDGGLSTGDDEYQGIGDKGVTQNPRVYTGQISGTVTTGSTVIGTFATIGNGTQGQDRLLVDTATQIPGNSFAGGFTGNLQIGPSGPSAEVVATATDSSANYPLSTMMLLCYPGSDNGAGGAAGCTSGSQPVGYIPAQSTSTTGFSPLASVVTNVVPSFTESSPYTGLPAGFCTPGTLQSSNPSASCYLPASGVGMVADQSNYETVNFTYDSGSHTVTLLNLRFPHNNGMTFSYGGLEGSAVSSNADTYSGGGTSGYEGQVFPVVGSVSATTLYYYSLPLSAVLGVSNDQGGGSVNGGMCFSTSASSYSLGADNHTVTFQMSPPSGNENPELYNGLTVTINTGNAAYNGSFAVTQMVSPSSYSFSYFLPSTPGGSAPSSGTVSFCNTSYWISPAARVLSVYDTATNQVDGTMTVMPNNVPWATGDPIFEAEYANVNTSAQGGANSLTQFTPRNYIGEPLQGYTTQGLVSGAGTNFFGISNGTPFSQYAGYGGTHVLPSLAYGFSGAVSDDLGFTAPDQAVIKISGCKGDPIGCSSVNSNFDVVLMPALPNGVAGVNGIDTLNYDPNYDSATRYLGLNSGKWTFGRDNGGSQFSAVEAGYLLVDQSVTAPAVSTNNLFTTQLTGIGNSPTATCTGTCTTSYHYYIVGHALSSLSGPDAVTTPVTVGVVDNAASLSSSNYNLICVFHNPGYASYDILRGDTAHSITLALSATVPNGASFGTVANYSCIKDTGLSTTAYSTPTSNTTGGAGIAGPLQALSIQQTDVSSAGCAQYDSSGNLTSTGTGCGGGGSSAWSSLANPTGNLSLTMGTNTSTFANTPVFTATQNNQNWVLNGGSVNFGTEFQNFQNAFNSGTYFFSDNFDVGMDVPSSTSIYQADTVGLYATCGSTTTDCLPLYTQARRTAAGAPIWGANINAWDDSFGGANMFPLEVDAKVQSTTTTGEAIRVLSEVVSGATYNGLHFVGTGVTSHILMDNDSAANAMMIGHNTSTESSLPIVMTSSSGTGTFYYNSGPGFQFSTSVASTSVGMASFFDANLSNAGILYSCFGVNTSSDNCVNTIYSYTSSGASTNHYGPTFTNASEGNWEIYPNYSTEFGETTPAAGPANGIAVGTTGQATIDGSGNGTFVSIAGSGSFLITNPATSGSLPEAGFYAPNLNTSGQMYINFGVSASGSNNSVYQAFHYAGSGSASNWYGSSFAGVTANNYALFVNASSVFGETTPAAGPANGIAVGTTGQFQVTGAGAVTAPSINGLTTPTPSGSAVVTQTIASGTATMGTSLIASGACATAVTVAATNVLTTDTITSTFNADPTSTAGYTPGAMLTIVPYPTAGDVNFKVCNNTASSITPSAVTLNWSVHR